MILHALLRAELPAQVPHAKYRISIKFAIEGYPVSCKTLNTRLHGTKVPTPPSPPPFTLTVILSTSRHGLQRLPPPRRRPRLLGPLPPQEDTLLEQAAEQPTTVECETGPLQSVVVVFTLWSIFKERRGERGEVMTRRLGVRFRILINYRLDSKQLTICCLTKAWGWSTV